VVPTAGQLEHVRRLYLGELRHLDAALGRFIEALERDGALDTAIIVLVGVHGEEFLDHGGMGHGATLFEESVHVPLLIHAPELLAPGRVMAPVDLLDLSPTLADLAGLGVALEWQGESLVPIIDDPVPPPRASIASLGDGSRAVWVDRFKLIAGPGRGGGSTSLFDLAADPDERADLAPQRGIAFRMLRTALAWEVPEQARWKRARWGTGANLASAFAIDHGM
jgi:arylsulfatase A-like enzyme